MILPTTVGRTTQVKSVPIVVVIFIIYENFSKLVSKTKRWKNTPLALTFLFRALRATAKASARPPPAPPVGGPDPPPVVPGLEGAAPGTIAELLSRFSLLLTRLRVPAPAPRIDASKSSLPASVDFGNAGAAGPLPGGSGGADGPPGGGGGGGGALPIDGGGSGGGGGGALPVDGGGRGGGGGTLLCTGSGGGGGALFVGGKGGGGGIVLLGRA